MLAVFSWTMLLVASLTHGTHPEQPGLLDTDFPQKSSPGNVAVPSSPRAPRRDKPHQPIRCAALYRARQYVQARKCFETLVRGAPHNSVFLFALGYCHYQLRNYEAALHRFRQAAAANPSDGDSRFMIGLTLAHMGRHRPALQALRRSLVLGLDSERPQEARRLIRILDGMIHAAGRPGWHIVAEMEAGFDSHPRIEELTTRVGTSEGTNPDGSGVTALHASLGYGFLLGHRLDLKPLYDFSQWLVWSDLDPNSTGQTSRAAVPAPELSLQHHELALRARMSRSRWRAIFHVSGIMEITGMRVFAPFLAAMTASAQGLAHWHRITSTRAAIGVVSGWALDSTMDYLTGSTLWTSLSQKLAWRMLGAELGYQFARAWLGAATQSASDCAPGQACPLSQPFSHQAHQAWLCLRLRPLSWLTVWGRGTFTRWLYEPGVEIRTSRGPRITVTRSDFTQDYHVGMRFRVWQGMSLHVRYRYVHNRSNLTQEETGLDESYSRHQVLAGIRYAR